MAATGGGKQNTEILTSQEEQVLNIMCPTSIHGHPDVEESSINILEDSEVRCVCACIYAYKFYKNNIY